MRLKVKINFSIILFSFFYIIGCDAATVKTHTNSKIQVNPCGFDYDIDNYYCTVDKINLYKSNIGHKIDFDKDYTIVKINDGKYVRLVAINQKIKKSIL